ncbi:MAG: F0F1 ATP synthase subunit B [Clostridiales bacterium]|nr:F0F1 ATP synthase subunit B [Clostridiales bacterium]
MELYPLDIVLHIINIIVLCLLLRLILFRPVSLYLSERSDRICHQLTEAETRLNEAETLKQEYQKQLDKAIEESHDVIRTSKTKATQEAEAILSDAKVQTDRLFDETQERIVKEKDRALEQMRQEVAQLSVDIAARILKREVNKADNLALAEAFFREMRKK